MSRSDKIRCPTCGHLEHDRNPCPRCVCQRARLRILRGVGQRFGLINADEWRRVKMLLNLERTTSYAEFGHYDKDLEWVAELPIVEVDLKRMEVIP